MNIEFQANELTLLINSRPEYVEQLRKAFAYHKQNPNVETVPIHKELVAALLVDIDNSPVWKDEDDSWEADMKAENMRKLRMFIDPSWGD